VLLKQFVTVVVVVLLFCKGSRSLHLNIGWPLNLEKLGKVGMRSVKSPENITETSGYATMVHGGGCNPHRCTTAFANLEITSLMTS